jgi:hypothetical protein
MELQYLVNVQVFLKVHHYTGYNSDIFVLSKRAGQGYPRVLPLHAFIFE